MSVLISIVVPVYNIEKYLTECLDSIINQSYCNLEIITIDDCSTDKSWNILQEYAYKDKRLRIFKNKYHTGHPSVARNTGIQIAQGEYIGMVDSDDLLQNDAILKCVEKIVSFQPDILYTNYIGFDDATKIKIISPNYFNHKNKIDGSYKFNCKSATDDFWFTMNNSACFKIYKKSFLINEKLEFQELRFEDVNFSINSYCAAKSIYCLNEALYYIRLNRIGNNKNRDRENSIRQCLDGVEGLRHSFRYISSLDVLPELQEIIYYKFYTFIIDYIKYLPKNGFYEYIITAKELFEEIKINNIIFYYFSFKEKRNVQNILKNKFRKNNLGLTLSIRIIEDYFRKNTNSNKKYPIKSFFFRLTFFLFIHFKLIIKKYFSPHIRNIC